MGVRPQDLVNPRLDECRIHYASNAHHTAVPFRGIGNGLNNTLPMLDSPAHANGQNFGKNIPPLERYAASPLSGVEIRYNEVYSPPQSMANRKRLS